MTVFIVGQASIFTALTEVHRAKKIVRRRSNASHNLFLTARAAIPKSPVDSEAVRLRIATSELLANGGLVGRSRQSSVDGSRVASIK